MDIKKLKQLKDGVWEARTPLPEGEKNPALHAAHMMREIGEGLEVLDWKKEGEKEIAVQFIYNPDGKPRQEKEEEETSDTTTPTESDVVMWKGLRCHLMVDPSDGSLTLRADGWYVLKIQENGKLYRHTSVGSSKFSLNPRGQVNITEDPEAEKPDGKPDDKPKKHVIPFGKHFMRLWKDPADGIVTLVMCSSGGVIHPTGHLVGFRKVEGKFRVVRYGSVGSGDWDLGGGGEVRISDNGLMSKDGAFSCVPPVQIEGSIYAGLVEHDGGYNLSVVEKSGFQRLSGRLLWMTPAEKVIRRVSSVGDIPEPGIELGGMNRVVIYNGDGTKKEVE